MKPPGSQSSLFGDAQHSNPAENRSPGPLPIYEALRPTTWEDFIGQEHLVAPGWALRLWIDQDQLPSMILWGPPGSGKTTLARLIARLTQLPFVPFSAVTSGIKEVKETLALAQQNHLAYKGC